MTEADVDRLTVLVARLQEFTAERLRLAEESVAIGKRIVATLDELERELEQERAS